MRRYRCRDRACGWQGLLAPRQPAAAPLPPRRRRMSLPAGMALGGVALLVAAWWLRGPQAGEQAVMVGHHVVPRGAHLEGDRLPAAHPLTAVLPPKVLEDEPGGYREDEAALLRVRRQCAWGLPGRNPYRGSVAQALQTAQLPERVVHRIAADVKAGRKADRLTIGNDDIVAEGSGRRFDPARVAMTYGMTMCVDTRVNFRPGHREQADLYEAMDEDGRIYAVMVPEVCGNVSVLGQRYDEVDLPPTSAGRPRERPQWSGREAEWSPDDPRPWMRVPPEQRRRDLPRLLVYADKPGDPGDEDRRTRAVPEPGALALALLALAAAGALRRR